MKTLSGLLPETYTLSNDPDVVFTLKPLTAADRLDILGTANDAKKFGQAMQQACEYSITGWRGLKDADGKDVPYSMAEVKRLPVDILIEVAQHALDIAKADDSVKKTSGSRSRS